ncbi:MAG: glutamate 5-kinase [Oceanococcus sp.]
MNRSELGACKRWVIKVGSSLLTDNGQAVAHAAVAAWVEQIAGLRARGIDVVVVSSGAVAAGMLRLNLAQRPTRLSQLQAAAAVGQLDVASLWDSALQKHGLQAAQVLLTHEDAAERQRYLNARNTIRALLGWGVVPVVNENDTVAHDEIRFGDNDRLAAVVADLSSADLLVILTDQAGLYSADPREDSSAQLISSCSADDKQLSQMAGSSGGALGRGGMQTKLMAARMASRYGVPTVIAGGAHPDVLNDILAGQEVGSLLYPADKDALSARKRWIASQQRVVGQLCLDAGASQAVTLSGRSLLPVGVTCVQGDFLAGDLVQCLNEQGVEIARGLSNYDAASAAALCGVPSARINEVLGWAGEKELIHRDNLVLT